MRSIAIAACILSTQTAFCQHDHPWDYPRLSIDVEIKNNRLYVKRTYGRSSNLNIEGKQISKVDGEPGDASALCARLKAIEMECSNKCKEMRVPIHEACQITVLKGVSKIESECLIYCEQYITKDEEPIAKNARNEDERLLLISEKTKGKEAQEEIARLKKQREEEELNQLRDAAAARLNHLSGMIGSTIYKRSKSESTRFKRFEKCRLEKIEIEVIPKESRLLSSDCFSYTYTIYGTESRFQETMTKTTSDINDIDMPYGFSDRLPMKSEWPTKIKSAIQSGKVLLGMTVEQVALTIDTPLVKHAGSLTKSGNVEIYAPVFSGTTMYKFFNGRLASVLDI